MNAAPSGTGLFAALKALLDTVLGLLQTRAALLAVELEEERERLLALLLYGTAAFFFLSFGLVMLAIFLTALFWETHRLLVIGSFTTLFLTCGVFACILVRRLLKRATPLFSSSLGELAQDRASLQGVLAPLASADGRHDGQKNGRH